MDISAVEGADRGVKAEEIRKAEGTSEVAERFKKEAALGRTIVGLTKAREERRLTPFTDIEKFAREDINEVVVNPDSATEEQVKKARAGSLGLAIEAVAQISEAKIQRQGQVREDLDFLEPLMKLTIDGNKLVRESIQEDEELFAQKAREAFSRRQEVPAENVNLDNGQLADWVNEQFVRAHNRLGSGIQAMRGYLGR